MTMAKVHTTKSGSKYLSHDEVQAEQMKDPVFRTAYMERRVVQEVAHFCSTVAQHAQRHFSALAAFLLQTSGRKAVSATELVDDAKATQRIRLGGHLVPCLAVEQSARLLLTDSAPLLEEERHSRA